jgi:hypothetical protein
MIQRWIKNQGYSIRESLWSWRDSCLESSFLLQSYLTLDLDIETKGKHSLLSWHQKSSVSSFTFLFDFADFASSSLFHSCLHLLSFTLLCCWNTLFVVVSCILYVLDTNIVYVGLESTILSIPL